MSIYSGFATRTQENYYDQVIYNVISTLLVRISKIYNEEHVDENAFMRIISNQEKLLRKLEKRKVDSILFSTWNPNTRNSLKISSVALMVILFKQSICWNIQKAGNEQNLECSRSRIQ